MLPTTQVRNWPFGIQIMEPLKSDMEVNMSSHGGNMERSDAESDAGGASADEDINNIDTEKLDASHREILEKLKRQELEEREEIERELQEAQRDAMIRVRHQDSDMRDPEDQEERDSSGGGPSPPPQTEIKTQRPKGLLAHHGMAPKVHNNNNDNKDRLMLGAGKDLNGSDKDLSERGSSEHMPPCPMDFPHPAFLDRRAFAPSPPSLPATPPSASGPPGSRDSATGSPLGSSTPGHHWTFEEQFKQLYELSDEPKRREFLDDLFSFMQKRGTPVNRIPIMAKQTLDLYELFRLVVSKGGLVEVINKKLWREITKGLNLPSSITSAAFTLRTQYMKYLYPYECEKLKLSNPSELQSAIDGNRREGRRPSYGYDFSPMPSMMPTPPPPPPHLNGALAAFNGGRPTNGPDAGLAGLWGPPRGPLKDSPWNIMPPSLHMPGAAHDDDLDQPKNLKKEKLESNEGGRMSTPTNHIHRSLAERDARAMEAAARAMEEATKSAETVSEASRHRESASGGSSSGPLPRKIISPLSDEPPSKRMAMDDDRIMAQMAMRSAHMKITSRGDGRSEFDNSLVVSMEINGIMYQGVLFAQFHPRRI